MEFCIMCQRSRFATSAPPEDVEATFVQKLAVGKAFGTIVVIVDGIVLSDNVSP